MFVILQLLRVWVIATLGPRWTTRIIVLPGAPLVAVGPYRFVSHPNYWVVAAEILVLPLVFGLVWYGIAFSVLNTAVLWIRIRAEDTALTRRPEISRGTRAPTARAHSAHLVPGLLRLDALTLVASNHAAWQRAAIAQKYVRAGKRATDDGEWQFFVRRIEFRARLPPSHRGRTVGAIAFERRVCRT